MFAQSQKMIIKFRNDTISKLQKKSCVDEESDKDADIVSCTNLKLFVKFLFPVAIIKNLLNNRIWCGE